MQQNYLTKMGMLLADLSDFTTCTLNHCKPLMAGTMFRLGPHKFPHQYEDYERPSVTFDE